MVQVGPYEVLEELGRGGGGVVYRARGEDGREVALKLSLEGTSSTVVRRLEREAQALLRLDHPYLLTLRDHGLHQGRPYLVTDFLQGGSLQDRLDSSGPLPALEAVRLVHDLARALHYAHMQGVLHRDVKPANVLVDREGQIRLSDFGLVKETLDPTQTALSKTGVLMGTPGYWAPELARGELERVGPATDVFGLGATLYALISGRAPFAGESLVDAVAALARPLERLSALVPGVDPRLEQVVERCLRREPARRFPTALAVAEALEPLLYEQRPPAGSQASVLAALLVGIGIGFMAGVLVAAPAGSSPAAPSPLASASASPPTTGWSSPPAPSPASASAADLLGRGRALRGEHNYAGAAEVLALAVELAPGEAQAWRELALALYRVPALERAEAAASRFVELEPAEAGAWSLRATVRADLGDYQGCYDDAVRAVEVGPGSNEGHHLKGLAALELGRLSEGLEAIERAIEVVERRGREPPYTYLNSLGNALVKLRRDEEALRAYARAIAREPRAANPYGNLGLIYVRQGRWTEAARAGEEALRRDPNHLQGLLVRGTARQQLGDAPGAAGDFQRLVQLAPPGSRLRAQAQANLEELSGR